MTLQGIIALNLIAIMLIVWVSNLVRKGRLYVGYGIIFIGSTMAVMLLLLSPRLLQLVSKLLGAVFPASALTLLALGFIVVMLIYILSQLTILSNRVTKLMQTLAIRDAESQARDRPVHDARKAGANID
jgi:hypothetical protein